MRPKGTWAATVVSLAVVSAVVPLAPPSAACGQACGAVGSTPASDVLALADCRETLVGFDVPVVTLRPLVPDEFRLASFTGGILTGHVLVWVLECQRGPGGTEALPARLLQVFAFVVPRDPTWTEIPGLGYYVLDLATDHPAVLEFFERRGVAIVPATFLGVSNPRTPAASLEAWTVVSDSWATVVAAPFVRTLNPEILARGIHVWTGAGPFVRFTMRHVDETAPGGLSVASAASAGLSALARVQPAGAFLGQVSAVPTFSYAFDGFFPPV